MGYIKLTFVIGIFASVYALAGQAKKDKCASRMLREATIESIHQFEQREFHQSEIDDADEIEYKFELTRKSYERLLESADVVNLGSSRLRNYYFDTKDLKLFKGKIRLRLRTVDKSHGEVTIKVPSKSTIKSKHPPKVRRELTAAMDVHDILRTSENKSTIILPPTMKELIRPKVAKLEKLKCLGKVKTKRTLLQLPNGLVLEVDKSDILGDSVYELEIEIGPGEDPEDTFSYVQKFLERNDIDHELTELSKSRRFFTKLRSNS